MFDPSKVQTVEKQTVRKSQDFDIKYDSEKQSFTISDNFIEKNGLSNNGLAFGVYPDGSLILSIQSEENSKFYKRKGGSSKKGKGFKHPILSDRLNERGFDSGSLPIELVGQTEDAKYYKVSGSETETGSPISADRNDLQSVDTSSKSLMEEEDEFL